MTIETRQDLLPPTLLGSEVSDEERKILGGRVFPLDQVKQHIVRMGVDGLNFATHKATEDLSLRLNWKPSDLCDFILTLGGHRYVASQWCYGSGFPKIPFPADIYIMGYNRFTKAERQSVEPWVYLKFGFSPADQTVEIFSAHPADELLK